MLADGSGSEKTPTTAAAEAPKATDTKPTAPEVPAKSAAIVRASGMGGARLALAFESASKDGKPAAPERIEAETKKDANEVQEIRYELAKSGTLRAYADGEELAAWAVTVTPDELPKISLSRPPELTPRGSLKITFKAEDDFGVASGKINLKRAPDAPRDAADDWAKREPLTGPVSRSPARPSSP